VDNDIQSSGLVFLRRSPEVIVRADNGKDVIASRIVGTVINGVGINHWSDQLHGRTAPFKRFSGEENSGKRIVHFSFRGSITKSFFFCNYEVLKSVFPSREEKLEIRTNKCRGMPNIFHGNSKLKGGLFGSLRKHAVTESLKAEGWNKWVITKRFNIYDFYPGPLGQFQLLACGFGLGLHSLPHFVRDSGVYGRSNNGRDSGGEHADLKRYFPPWRFVMAALASIFGIGWGWWNLRLERRQVAGLIVFVFGICIWGYAVDGLMWWSLKF